MELTFLGEVVLLLGNGPSGEQLSLSLVRQISGGFDRVARFNHFYIGENFGYTTDDLFFAADDALLISNLFDYLSSGHRQARRLMTPLSRTRLGPLSFLDIPVVNFWTYLLEDDFFSSIYIRGSQQKLPTSGLQALHYYLTQGVRRFVVAGFDFYSSPVRYAHAKQVATAKLSHGGMAGYETSAHTLQDDVNYLLHLVKRYNFEIVCLSAEEPWRKIESVCRQLVGTRLKVSYPDLSSSHWDMSDA